MSAEKIAATIWDADDAYAEKYAKTIFFERSNNPYLFAMNLRSAVAAFAESRFDGDSFPMHREFFVRWEGREPLRVEVYTYTQPVFNAVVKENVMVEHLAKPRCWHECNVCHNKKAACYACDNEGYFMWERFDKLEQLTRECEVCNDGTRVKIVEINTRNLCEKHHLSEHVATGCPCAIGGAS